MCAVVNSAAVRTSSRRGPFGEASHSRRAAVSRAVGRRRQAVLCVASAAMTVVVMGSFLGAAVRGQARGCRDGVGDGAGRGCVQVWVVGSVGQLKVLVWGTGAVGVRRG